jgi:hypothetical protein
MPELLQQTVEGIEMTLWLGTKKEYLDTVLQWLHQIAEGMSGVVLLAANEYSDTYDNVTKHAIILEKNFSPSTADDLLEMIKAKRMNPVEILVIAVGLPHTLMTARMYGRT